MIRMARIAALTAVFVFAMSAAFGQTVQKSSGPNSPNIANSGPVTLNNGAPEKKTEAAVAIPSISSDFKLKFFKAQSELNQAELALEQTPAYKTKDQKLAVFQGLVNELTALCGANATPGMDGTSSPDPTCLPKLPPPAPPAAPSAPAKK